MLDNTSSLTRSLLLSGTGAWSSSSAIPSPSEDVIDLTIADPDLPPPEAVVARAVAALRAGDSRYPEIAGRTHVRRAIAERHELICGQRASAENVLLAPGAQGALYLATRCIAGPGDHILAIEPHYLNYPATLAASGATVDYVRADPDSDFCLTEAAILAALRTNTKAIVLSNPNNPTGRILTPGEIHTLATLALQRDLWIVCDEVYRDLCHEKGFASLASRGLIDDRLVTLGSLSKSHAMAGWRFGWMVAPSPFVTQATRLADVVFHGIPGFIQEAAVTALADHAAPREAAALHCHRGKIFADRLSGSAIAVRLPQAGPFLLCDVRGTGLSGARFVEVALAEAKLGLVDGGRFGRSAAGFVRIAVTSSEALLSEAAERLARLARRLPEHHESHSHTQAELDIPPTHPIFADGVYISPSGMVHVWRDGNLEGIF